MVSSGWQHMGVVRGGCLGGRKVAGSGQKQQQWLPWGGGGEEERMKVMCVIYLVANGPKHAKIKILAESTWLE